MIKFLYTYTCMQTLAIHMYACAVLLLVGWSILQLVVAYHVAAC